MNLAALSITRTTHEPKMTFARHQSNNQKRTLVVVISVMVNSLQAPQLQWSGEIARANRALAATYLTMHVQSDSIPYRFAISPLIEYNKMLNNCETIGYFNNCYFYLDF